jgi:hypothetical protein
MSKEFSDLLRDESSGGSVMPPGLSLSKILSDVGSELSHQVEAGAHELAAALFNGNAFVMYGRADHGDEQQRQAEGHEM